MEKQPLLSQQQQPYPPPNYQQQQQQNENWQSPPQTFVSYPSSSQPGYPENQQSTPPVVVINHQHTSDISKESNWISAVLFGVGWIFPITWCIGSCVPVKSSIDQTFRIVNRVFSCLILIGTIIVVIVVIVAAVNVSKNHVAIDCETYNGAGRCYNCFAEDCTAYTIDNFRYKKLTFEYQKSDFLYGGLVSGEDVTYCDKCSIDSPQKCVDTQIKGYSRCVSCDFYSVPSICALISKHVSYRGSLTYEQRKLWIDEGVLPKKF
jgi:hypothetical protein